MADAWARDREQAPMTHRPGRRRGGFVQRRRLWRASGQARSGFRRSAARSPGRSDAGAPTLMGRAGLLLLSGVAVLGHLRAGHSDREARGPEDLPAHQDHPRRRPWSPGRRAISGPGPRPFPPGWPKTSQALSSTSGGHCSHPALVPIVARWPPAGQATREVHQPFDRPANPPRHAASDGHIGFTPGQWASRPSEPVRRCVSSSGRSGR